MMNDTISDIMGLAVMQPSERARQLCYIVDDDDVEAINSALGLPHADAECIIRKIVGNDGQQQVKRTDKAHHDLSPKKWFPQSMLTELRDACNTPREYAMIAVGYWCGLRGIEYTLLQWTDIGWTPQGISRGQTDVISVTRVKKKVRIRNELVTRMIHDVVLDHGTIRALRELWSSREGADLDSPWIFPGINGEQACGRTILRHFHRIAKRCESYDPLEYRWRRIHSLKHSIAVHMVLGGFEMVDIQTRLGHSSLESTRVYAQIPTPRRRQTAREMSLSSTVVGF